MIDLILIIMIIVSLAKPDILLSKKMKEKANEEQKNILTKNYYKNKKLKFSNIEKILVLELFFYFY